LRLANVDKNLARSDATVEGTPRRGSRDWAKWVLLLRKNFILLLPLLLMVFGLGIAISSLASDIEPVYTNSFSGNLTPGNTTLILDGTPAQYVQINLTAPGCGLRLYPATATQWVRFNTSGRLPPTWIDCTNRTTTTGATHYLVLVNGGTVRESYNVTAFAYSIGTPYGWLALPGTILALAGLVLFVPRIAMREAMRMRDEFERKKEK
jgi:hypothetical protein